MKSPFFTLEQLHEAKQVLTQKSKEMPSRISQHQLITTLEKDIQKLLKNGWTFKDIVKIFSEMNITISVATLRKSLKKVKACD